MRLHVWNELLRVKSAHELVQKCRPLTDDQYQQYLAITEEFINKDNFTFDFTRGWERCKWNREARKFAAKHFVESVKGGMYQKQPLPHHLVTETIAGEVLDMVMVHIFRLYSENSKLPTPQRQAKALLNLERKRADTRRSTVSPFRPTLFLLS